MNTCKIYSNSTQGDEYLVGTSSAIKAAAEHGRCEGGEVVQIYDRSGKLISEARYTPEDGGKYYSCTI